MYSNILQNPYNERSLEELFEYADNFASAYTVKLTKSYDQS